jgi:hypothetical protein
MMAIFTGPMKDLMASYLLCELNYFSQNRIFVTS